MSKLFSSDEVRGTDTLTIAAAVGATLLLFAAFASPAPVAASAVTQTANPRIETVTVTASPIPSFT